MAEVGGTNAAGCAVTICSGANPTGRAIPDFASGIGQSDMLLFAAKVAPACISHCSRGVPTGVGMVFATDTMFAKYSRSTRLRHEYWLGINLLQ